MTQRIARGLAATVLAVLVFVGPLLYVDLVERVLP